MSDQEETPSKMHSIYRTSPKGEPFIGTCSLCGKTGLRILDMNNECENIRGLSEDRALLEAITGADDE